MFLWSLFDTIIHLQHVFNHETNGNHARFCEFLGSLSLTPYNNLWDFFSALLCFIINFIPKEHKNEKTKFNFDFCPHVHKVRRNKSAAEIRWNKSSSMAKAERKIIDGIKATGRKRKTTIGKILVYMRSQYSRPFEIADSNIPNIFIRTLQEYLNARCLLWFSLSVPFSHCLRLLFTVLRTQWYLLAIKNSCWS